MPTKKMTSISQETPDVTYTMVFLQVHSDLHLEFYKKIAAVPTISPRAPILVLAGDVGYPTLPLFWEFLERSARDFQHILLVFGNHEYYNSSNKLRSGKALSMTKMEELVRGMLAYKGLTNIHLLQKSTVELEGIRFVGATLWSHVPPELASEIQASMNDYRTILVTDTDLLTVADTNRLHADHAAWLRETLAAANPTQPIVVITHHLPTTDLIAEKYAGSPVNAAFASDFLLTLEDSQVPTVWICGHTHSPNQKTVRGCKCFINPWGYPGENKGRGEDMLGYEVIVGVQPST